MRLYVGISLAMASVFALIGTNSQAALAKARLIADADPLIAEAGRFVVAWSDLVGLDEVPKAAKAGPRATAIRS